MRDRSGRGIGGSYRRGSLPLQGRDGHSSSRCRLGMKAVTHDMTLTERERQERELYRIVA